MMLRCWLEGLDGSRRRVGTDGLLLGRGAECAFRTLDTRISARHAEVNLRDHGLFLTPRGIIPTVLNGRPVHNPRQLEDGSWISLAPGVVLRVLISSRPAAPWTVTDGEKLWSLDIGSPPVALSAGILSVDSDGNLLLAFQDQLTLNGQLISPDQRPWSLAAGDTAVLADGATLRISGGDLPIKPPTPWSVREPLRYHPPHAISKLSTSRIAVCYADELVEVAVRDDALIDALLAAERPIKVEPAALLRLQEDLIRAGIDGFCLLPHSSEGAMLQRKESLSSATPPRAHALPQSMDWWLGMPDGGRLWLDPGGILLGRNPDCDVRNNKPYIHRYHALLRQRTGTVELIPLGRNPSYVDGVPVNRPTEISEGSWVAMSPSQRIWIQRSPRPVQQKTSCTVQLGGQDAHTVRLGTCRIGGSSQDDLLEPSWPAGALCLYLQDEAVFVEATIPAKLNDITLAPRRVQRLEPGQSIAIGEQTLTLLAHQPIDTTPPRMVVLQPFQHAGRLLFRFENRSQIRVCLPKYRYHLMEQLLEAYVGSRLRSVTRTRYPGELPDTDLPRGAIRTRELQVELSAARGRLSRAALRDLLHQVRTDLVRAGINGDRMLESGSGWTRLHLGESCNVTLYS